MRKDATEVILLSYLGAPWRCPDPQVGDITIGLNFKTIVSNLRVEMSLWTLTRYRCKEIIINCSQKAVQGVFSACSETHGFSPRTLNVAAREGLLPW